MTRSERDLVSALRSELAAIDPSRPCDRRAEAAGLGAATPTREGPVARLAIRLDRGRGHGRDPVSADDTGGGTFDWASAAEHCRMAYLRGLFLARGSLSLASGRTHLEFVVDPDEAPTLAERLDEVGPAGVVAPAARPRRRHVEERRHRRAVPATDRRWRRAPRARGPPGIAGPARRPEPRHQRRIGEPPAGRRCGRPADRRDRGAGR